MKLLLAASLPSLVACEAIEGDDPERHTGTIRLQPQDGEERRFTFDKEEGGCEIVPADPACDGGTSWLLYATGFEEGTGQPIGVDFDWCGASAGVPAIGFLQVDVGLRAPQETFLVNLEGDEDLVQRGTRIRFSAPYDDFEGEDLGILHFEADCSRGGAPTS